MAAISRHLHLVSRSDWLPLEHAFPGAHTAEGEPLMALVHTDPDGEQHVYPFDEAGRKRLLSLLTGGVVIPHTKGGAAR